MRIGNWRDQGNKRPPCVTTCEFAAEKGVPVRRLMGMLRADDAPAAFAHYKTAAYFVRAEIEKWYKGKQKWNNG